VTTPITYGEWLVAPSDVQCLVASTARMIVSPDKYRGTPMNFNAAAFTRSGSSPWAEAFAKASGICENDASRAE
jgi:hypothetical protein